MSRFIDNLVSASDSAASLSYYIGRNSVNIYDYFFKSSYDELSLDRSAIESYILPYLKVYRGLDFGIGKNKLFVFCLLNYSQRFGLLTEFEQLYNLSLENSISLSSRLTAASRFLIRVHSFTDYSSRMLLILQDLTESFLNEEDSSAIVFSTLIQYYLEVVNNFGRSNLNGVIEFRNALKNELNSDRFNFLFSESVSRVLDFSLTNIDTIYFEIQRVLDSFRSIESPTPVTIGNGLIIESNTEYCSKLSLVNNNIQEILGISRDMYSSIASNRVFYSLQRGVSILTTEDQLLAYMHSYGKMHYAKIKLALSKITNINLAGELEVYDWACGQAIATMALLERVQGENILSSINKITLIEPSIISLKRGTLNVKKFIHSDILCTINETFDSLSLEIFDSNIHYKKVHLFSNILDVDFFSLYDLVNIIKGSFNGYNLFVCVSPFINEAKTQRINDFVECFSTLSDFDLLYSETKRRGEWIGTNWSMTIRIFKVCIP